MFGRLRRPRAEARLAPLASLVEGTVSGGRLRGMYRGYRLEARSERKDPWPSSWNDSSASRVEVDVFNVCLYGVPGRQSWFCDRLGRLSLRLTVGDDFQIKSEFGVEWEHRVRKHLGLFAGPDSALRDRLRAAGLIELVGRLERGSCPPLPRVSFRPSQAEVARAWLGGKGAGDLESMVKQTLRATGQAGLESAVDERLRAASERSPSQLCFEVEMTGNARVPSETSFRELLDLVARIARINVEANPPTERATGA